MNVINIRFFGLDSNISSWINDGEWYKTDRINSVAVEVVGNNGGVIVPLKMVSRIEIRQLDCENHAFNLSKGGYCVNCGIHIDEYKKLEGKGKELSSWEELR